MSAVKLKIHPHPGPVAEEKPEYNESLGRAVVDFLQPKLQEIIGPEITCHLVNTPSEATVNLRRVRRTGSEQAFLIGDQLVGFLHFPSRVFSEAVDIVVGHRERVTETLRTGHLSQIEALIHLQIGEAIAQSLSIAIPKASGLVDPDGFAVFPDVSFSAEHGQHDDSDFYDGSWLILTLAIAGKCTRGLVNIMLPTLEILKRSEMTDKYSAIHESWEAQLGRLKVIHAMNLEKSIRRYVAVLGIDSFYKMIEMEPDFIKAACLRCISEPASNLILRNMPTDAAERVIHNLVHLRRPRTTFLAILCNLLNRRITERSKAEKVQRLIDMRSRWQRGI